jgi:hypothetical protein
LKADAPFAQAQKRCDCKAEGIAIDNGIGLLEEPGVLAALSMRRSRVQIPYRPPTPAPLAQPVRAPLRQGGGRWFKSSMAHQASGPKLSRGPGVPRGFGSGPVLPRSGLVVHGIGSPVFNRQNRVRVPARPPNDCARVTQGKTAGLKQRRVTLPAYVEDGSGERAGLISLYLPQIRVHGRVRVPGPPPNAYLGRRLPCSVRNLANGLSTLEF